MGNQGKKLYESFSTAIGSGGARSALLLPSGVTTLRKDGVPPVGKGTRCAADAGQAQRTTAARTPTAWSAAT